MNSGTYNNNISAATSIWSSPAAMRTANRSARLIAASPCVPKPYAGDTGSCLLAMEIAARSGLPLLTVMQSAVIINGGFCWKGSACKALIDSCGLYTSTEYIAEGEPGTPERGVFLRAHKPDGSVVDGPLITLALANREGWSRYPGSKWRSYPEIMLRYRAAAYFSRLHCPASLLCFHTDDELRDRGEALETVTFSLEDEDKGVAQ